jgi:hypothetical protein
MVRDANPGNYLTWLIDMEYCGDGECNCDEICSTCETDCGVCDTTPPTSKITSILPALAYRPDGGGAYSAFLRADDNGYTSKIYWIYVEDVDNTGGSGVDTCYIEVAGNQRTRPCNDWTTLTVGRPVTGASCIAEGNDACKIKVWATDRRGNSGQTIERMVVSDEREFNRLDIYLDGFNVFDLGVDWTPPTTEIR